MFTSNSPEGFAVRLSRKLPLGVLAACAFALSTSLVTSLASADDAPAWVEPRVKEGLLKPLSDMEKSQGRFSRMPMPPMERRVRTLETQVDAQGRSFARFAVDAHYRGVEDWTQSVIVGCAYAQSRDIFVKIGDSYRPASFVVGKPGDVVAGVCEAAPPRT
jgi:hypothetical protein